MPAAHAFRREPLNILIVLTQVASAILPGHWPVQAWHLKWNFVHADDRADEGCLQHH